MGQVIGHTIGNVVSLELSYKQDGVGVTGLTVQVELRDAVTNKYLDFSDNAWKSGGWIQRSQNLVELGNGLYQYLWNSWASVRSQMAVVAEYAVLTPGYEAVDQDVLMFGLVEVIESGRWKITNNQMIFYAKDGVTPLLTFNLYDGYGIPSEVNVKERVKV